MSTSHQPLAGKVAIVSGSSTGIGAAIARELSRRGADVVINYPNEREKAGADKVLLGLQGHGGKSIAVEADLSTIDGPGKLAAAAAAAFGKIDILVNNAGLSVHSSLESSAEELAALFDRVLAVNGRGTLLLTQAVLKYLSPQNSRIVNISSLTSRRPEPDMSVYAGSKGLIESMTRCWARDLPRKYGCTVNAVAPGPVATETMLASPAEFLKLVDKLVEDVPVAARMATPEEIAWTVAMVCDEGASWINGVYVPVAGGMAFV